MNTTTTESKIILKDLGGRPIRFSRYGDGSALVESAANVALRAHQVDDLIRFLRPGLLPPRFTARVLGGSWAVVGSPSDEILVPTGQIFARFNIGHPDPEGAAKAEADRLNEDTP